MSSLKILEESTRGTAEFVTWEMLFEVVYDVDCPPLNVKAGKPAFIRGMAVQWWKWVGEGESWDGSMRSVFWLFSTSRSGPI